jgi:hypothetical protein
MDLKKLSLKEFANALPGSRRIKYYGLAGLLLLALLSLAQKKTQVWKVDSLRQIGGHSLVVWGNPKVLPLSGKEKALEFDGQQDGLLIDANPIAGAREFSIEVVFKPYDAFPQNEAQRFLHIQDPADDSRRILIELRLNNRKEWYGDWFIKAEKEGLTLIDSTKTFPVNEWATISLVYKDKRLRGFVNGKEQLSGHIEYLPISAAAKTAVGVRMNKRSWFNGAIKEIRFSNRALYPD